MTDLTVNCSIPRYVPGALPHLKVRRIYSEWEFYSAPRCATLSINTASPCISERHSAFGVLSFTPPPPLNKSARRGVDDQNQHNVAQINVTQTNNGKCRFSGTSVRIFSVIKPLLQQQFFLFLQAQPRPFSLQEFNNSE
jgi:hypothetical protein